MKKILFSVSVLSILSFFVSCSGGNEDDEARKKEREKIEEYIGGTKVQFYKAIKIAIRSTAAAGQSEEMIEARNTMLKIGGEALNLSAQPSDSAKTLNPFELFNLAGDLYKAKDVLTKTDEDSLPTILGNIYYAMNGMKSAEIPEIAGFKYDKEIEHAFIGLLWMASLKGPQEFTFYELHKCDENKIPYYDLVLLSKLTKSFAYYGNEFPWSGMDRATEYISICEKNKEKIISDPPFSFSDGKTGGEQTFFQLHGMGYLLKGLNEKKLLKDKEALADLETFVSDAEKGGLDNELTWVIGSYVFIKKEDKEKSLSYLSKLEKSDLLDQPEKEAVTEIRSYIEKRDNAAALNRLNDKIAIGKILFSVLKKRAENAKQLEQLKENPQGKKFLDLQGQLNQKAGLLDKMGGNLNTDSLTSKAGNLVKDLFSK